MDYLVVCRAVTESINQLITACAVSVAPGQKECDAAVRQIQVDKFGAVSHGFSCYKDHSLRMQVL